MILINKRSPIISRDSVLGPLPGWPELKVGACDFFFFHIFPLPICVHFSLLIFFLLLFHLINCVCVCVGGGGGGVCVGVCRGDVRVHACMCLSFICM